MALSERENDWVESLLQAVAADSGELSDWEKSFMGDQQSRYEQYGAEMFISPKQWGVLRRIANKVAHVSPSDI